MLELSNYRSTSSKFLLTLDDIFIKDCVDENIILTNSITNNDKQVFYWCDFESDNCSYENTMKSEWKRVMASLNNGNGPDFDHTFNSGNGSYLTSTPLTYFYGGLIERVVSMQITIPDDLNSYCLSFYYFMTTSYPIFYVFAIPLNGSSQNYTYQLNNYIWPTIPQGSSQYSYISNKWTWAVVNLVPGTFHIAFLVGNQNSFDLKMAIDDIKVHSCPAVNNPITSYSPYFGYYFEYDCDFEKNRCGFSDTYRVFNNIIVDVPSNWSRINGHEILYPKLGPIYDHTTNSSDGHFLNVNFTLPIRADFKAATRSPLIFAHREMCLEFYYYANTEMFSQTSKSVFGTNIGGCYGSYLYINYPFKNATEPTWNKVLIQLLGYSCREFLDFAFSGGDFLKTTFAIDDVKINRCDILNRTTTTTSTTTTTTTTTSTTIKTTSTIATTTISILTTTDTPSTTILTTGTTIGSCL